MDAIRLIEKLVGRRAEIVFRPRHPADVLATWADVTRARELLGWQARVGFEQGFERLVAWYGENRTWASGIATDD